MDYASILKNISKYINLQNHEIECFTTILKHKTVKQKEFLLRSGDVCRHETYVLKGCLRTYYTDDNGFEHVIYFSIEDWWAEDLFSFLTQTPAKYTIEALEDTEVLQIEKANLEKLYQQVPKFERFFRLSFQNAYIAQQERITQNLSFTAEERYTFFKKKYPYSEQRFSQKQVASYLGITPEFLSVLRKKMATRRNP